MQKHLPCRFRTVNLMDPNWHEARIVGLQWLSAKLLGQGKGLPDLYDWVNQGRRVKRDCHIDTEDFGWMRGMCVWEDWEVPRVFTFNPINSKAVLAHWRVLVAILKNLSPQECEDFHALDRRPVRLLVDPVNADEQEEFIVVDEVGPEEVEEQQVVGNATDSEQDQQSVVDLGVRVQPAELGPERVVELASRDFAIDSHFHPDRTARKLGVSMNIPTVVATNVGPEPKNRVELVGGVAVFCDPETYPAQFPLVPGFGCAVGFHPRHAQTFNLQVLNRMDHLLRMPNVVALGEVGLDRVHGTAEDWDAQERALVAILELCPPKTPLVLHVRDQDPHGAEVNARCLQLVKENVAPTQKIHLHCFTGTVEQVINWTSSFSRCYFGFTGLTAGFDPHQVAALKRVPEDRILLETDSPYLRTGNRQLPHTPIYIGEVARVVASQRGCSIRTLLQQSTENARRLYQI